MNGNYGLKCFTGKNIVRGYARHFAVDLLCSVKELEMLGYQFTPEYKEQWKKDKENRIKQRQERKRVNQDKEINMPYELDERFFYIAGCTPGGAPYGVTWEEMGNDRSDLFKDDEEIDFDGSGLSLADENEGIPF